MWFEKQEFTSQLGIRILLSVYTILGYRCTKLFLYPVTFYYFVVDKNARDSSRDYLNRISAKRNEKPPGFITVYRHLFSFAESILDQFLIWIKQPPLTSIEYHNKEPVLKQINKQQGFVLLSAHLGNLAVCQYLSTLRPKLKINIIIYVENSQQFNRLLGNYRTDADIKFYDANRVSPSTAIELLEKCKQGEVVVMAADRVPAKSKRVISIPFLGDQANFPEGPFILAGLLDCPVYTLFCLKIDGKYHMYFDFLSSRISLQQNSRRQNIMNVANEYTEILEKYCKLTPLQWNNFYDFWA